jgi:hypothetical protein
MGTEAGMRANLPLLERGLSASDDLPRFCRQPAWVCATQGSCVGVELAAPADSERSCRAINLTSVVTFAAKVFTRSVDVTPRTSRTHPLASSGATRQVAKNRFDTWRCHRGVLPTDAICAECRSSCTQEPARPKEGVSGMPHSGGAPKGVAFAAHVALPG